MTSLLDQVAQTLAHDPQQYRIKKLLICTCYGVWQDDLQTINAMEWPRLLTDLLQRSPTQETLQHNLNRVVKTLSKPVEYAHVANGIVRAMQVVYAPVSSQVLPATPADDSTQWFMAPQTLAHEPEDIPTPTSAAPPPIDPYDLALQQLTSHAESLRLKKLAYCIVYGQWLSDNHTLEQVAWSQILRDLLTLMPTLEHLQYLIYQVAQSLSKPQDYLKLGQVLLYIFTPLYAQGNNSSVDPSASQSFSAPSPGEITFLINGQSSAEGSGQVVENPVMDDRSADPTPREPVPTTPGQASGTVMHDRFNLRTTLMKHGNPLAAKILIVSLLHQPIDLNNHQDWKLLNQWDLDSLLESLLDQYPQADRLRQHLVKLAKSSPQEAVLLPVAGAILQALKPHCDQRMAQLAQAEAQAHTMPLFQPTFPPPP